jgi:diguanylate cyclase
MSKTKWSAMTELQETDSLLQTCRQRVMAALALIALVFLLPYAANNLLHARLLLGSGMLLSVLVVVVDAIALHFRRRPPLPLGLLLLPAIGAIALSLKLHGVIGALWTYPAVLLFHFIMSRRVANVYGVLLLVAVTSLVQYFIDLETALRFGLTLVVTVALLNVALNVIADLRRRLLEQTILDPLTRAYNRRYMESCLTYAGEYSRRTGTPATLLLIDIDHFKILNQVHGHAVGDDVLRTLTSVIRRRARTLDLLFRIDGEAFLVLLPDTDEAAAVGLADDLRMGISHTCLMQGYDVTVSIGVSELQGDESRDAWLKHADDALYLAKEMGRNRIVRRAGLYLLKTDRA